jgi:anti-sigma B factor antagonist
MSEAAESPLHLEIERKGSTVVVKCSGKLIAGVNDILYNRVKELLPDTKIVILDLKDLTRMDSMGLGTLVRIYVSCKSAGVTLELMHLSKQVRELLGLTNLMSVFTFIGESGIKMG